MSRWRVQRRWLCCAQLVLGAMLLVSCNTIPQAPINQSPVAAAQQQFVARSEPNLPLTPGHERFDYNLKSRSASEPLVCLTISGGGSRSAYYAARVMEELAATPSPSGNGSMLDSVRVISTVSAGSLAASWYVAHYDERYSPDFFAKFKNAMGVNLQWRTYGHMAIFPPLALELLASRVTRTDLLANEIDKLLGGKSVTFDDLRAQEMREDHPAPTLIVNGTVYNSGQRLVMTNLPPSRFPSLIPETKKAGPVSLPDPETIRTVVRPLHFEDIGSDIGSYRLANAVAASAAYPIVLAPVRLRVYPENIPPQLLQRAGDLVKSNSVYVADGGLVENQGLDALMSILNTMNRKQPIMVIIVDASQPMKPIVSDRKIWDPFTVTAQMYNIGTIRPLAFYETMATKLHDESKMQSIVVRMQGNDPETDAMLHNIPTSFKLSAKHREALEKAAHENYAQMRNSIVGAYQRLSRGK